MKNISVPISVCLCFQFKKADLSSFVSVEDLGNITIAVEQQQNNYYVCSQTRWHEQAKI